MSHEIKTRNGPVVLATAVVSSILLLSGIGYRVLAARLEGPAMENPISQDQLNVLPLEIDDWEGEDISLDEAIVKQTDTDAHLNRRYARKQGMEMVNFYMAYGVKARDLMPHRPEVCYTGNGWVLQKKSIIELTTPKGVSLPCNYMQFSRGALGNQKTSVLHYYIVNGEYSPDVSLLRFKAWKGSSGVGHIAQVQVTTDITALKTAEQALEIVSEFAAVSASPIAQLFKDAGNPHAAEEMDSVPEP